MLAIEADGATYHSSCTARDRDRLRQQMLENLGWRFHRIWSTDWFQRKHEEIERTMSAFDRALTAVAERRTRLPETRPVEAAVDRGQPANFVTLAPNNAHAYATAGEYMSCGGTISGFYRDSYGTLYSAPFNKTGPSFPGPEAGGGVFYPSASANIAADATSHLAMVIASGQLFKAVANIELRRR